MNPIKIWQPRYKDRTVLIATTKVVRGENIIEFTKAKEYEGMTFACDSSIIRACPVCSNGKIDCYAVPLTKLERIS